MAAAGADVVLASTCILTGACEMVLFGALMVEVGVVVGGDTEVKVPALDEIEIREDEKELDEEKKLRNEADEVVAEAALVLVGVEDAPALRLFSGAELAAELLTVLLELGNVGDAVETV